MAIVGANATGFSGDGVLATARFRLTEQGLQDGAIVLLDVARLDDADAANASQNTTTITIADKER